MASNFQDLKNLIDPSGKLISHVIAAQKWKTESHWHKYKYPDSNQ